MGGGLALEHGQGGIRTLDTVAGIPVFETGSFSHSDTCPALRQLLWGGKFSGSVPGFPVAGSEGKEDALVLELSNRPAEKVKRAPAGSLLPVVEGEG